MRKYRVYYHNPDASKDGFPLNYIKDEFGKQYVVNAKGNIVPSFLSKDFDSKQEALDYVNQGNEK